MTVKHSADIRRPLTRRCAQLGISASGTFELTPRCNLRCKMCYVRLTPEEMAPIGRERTAEEWLALGRAAVDQGMLFLLITGGEPTIRPDFPEIYEGLVSMGLSISINTNGTLLTPAIRELWHRLPPAQVNITLYGTCREDYEALCGNGNAFDPVVEGLNWLRDEGILVHLNTTMTPVNLPQWEKIEQFARDRDLELRMTAYCFPPVRRDGCTACDDYTRLAPEAAGELIVKDMYYREGADAILRRAGSIDVPLQNSCDLDLGEPMKCMAGRAQFWVNWNGTMTPCGMLNTPVVHPFRDGFSSAWEQLKRAVDAITLCPDCVNCGERATCMNCAAVTYAETGHFDGKPEYACRMNRAYRETLLGLASRLTAESEQNA